MSVRNATHISDVRFSYLLVVQTLMDDYRVKKMQDLIGGHRAATSSRCICEVIRPSPVGLCLTFTETFYRGRVMSYARSLPFGFDHRGWTLDIFDDYWLTYCCR